MQSVHHPSRPARKDGQLESLLRKTGFTCAARQTETTLRSRQLVLFGAGSLGAKTLAGLRANGIEPLIFADNNAKRWGESLDGLEIVSPVEAASRYSASATFAVTIWGAFAPTRMHEHIEQLHALGCADVMTFGPIFRAFPDALMPHYAVDAPAKLLTQSAEIRRAFGLWSDEASSSEYVAQVSWRLEVDFDVLRPPVGHIAYFPHDLRQLHEEEVFIDCGAFNGDTIRDFLRETHGRFGRIVAFEPDPINFAALEKSCLFDFSLPESKIVLLNAAVGARAAERVHIDVGSGPSSAVGSGSFEVDSVSIDAALSEIRPTIIKMDIEGSEMDALEGARKVIERHRPALAISCYHRQDHLWNIPLLIDKIAPGYSFYLRPHDFDGWDLVCYAIPDGTYQ